MEQGQIKVCSKCKQEKSFNDFAIARDKKDGKSSQCRICSRERGRNWREKCRSRPDIKIPATKKCACCKETKPAVEFYENKEKKSGLGSWCKICLAKKWVEHSFK